MADAFKDFEPLLNAVKDAGSRTRSMTYIFLVMIAVSIAVIRNYGYPQYETNEFRRARVAMGCITNRIIARRIADANLNDCEDLLRTRFEIGLEDIEIFRKRFDEQIGTHAKPTTVAQNDKEFLLYLKEMPIFRLIFKTFENEVDNRTKHEFFTIPLVSIELHQNDAWLMTGAFSLITLMILWASISREGSTIQYVSEYILDQRSAYLVLSSQLLAGPSNWLHILTKNTLRPKPKSLGSAQSMVASRPQPTELAISLLGGLSSKVPAGIVLLRYLRRNYFAKVRRILFMILYMLPCALHAFYIWANCSPIDYKNIYHLIGQKSDLFVRLEFFQQLVLFVLQAGFGIAAFRMHNRVDRLIYAIAVNSANLPLCATVSVARVG